LISALVLGSSSAQAFNLMDAYQLALVNDPVFQSAVKEYEAGLQNNIIGRSAVLPKLAAAYNQAANWATQWGAAYSGGPQIANTYQFSSNYTYLQLTQPLFSLEAYARWRQGSAQADMSSAKFVYSNQELLIRVMQAYADLLFAMDQQQFLAAERDAFHEQWKAARNMARHGEAARIDALEAEASYHVSAAKVIEANDGIALAKQKLESAIGAPVGPLDKVARLPVNFRMMRLATPKFEDWKQEALQTNAELKTAEHSVEVANQEYRKNHAAHYPVVNLVGSVTSQQSNTPVSIAQTTNQNYVGVQVSLPIFSGGEIYGKSSQAYSNYEKSKADYDATKERVITEVRKQFDLVVTSQQKIEALSLAQGSATELVKAMRRSITFGEKTYIDVLIAEKGLYSTRKDLAQAKYNYLIAYLKLYQQAGTLSLDQFGQVATYFRATK
jgi:protease secretion system outer membrane protein